MTRKAVSFMFGVLTTLLLVTITCFLTKDSLQLQRNAVADNKRKADLTSVHLARVGSRDDPGSNVTAIGYCSLEASNLGPNQKVMSYCLFGNYSHYGNGLPSILETAKELYPGWNVRVYAESKLYKDIFRSLSKNYSNFFVCDVANIPGPPHDIRYMDPRLWRLTSLADDQVDEAIFRDIDAVVIPREAAAVNEFMASGKTLHLMRDHYWHTEPLQAGMFGVHQTNGNRDQLRRIRETLFREGSMKLNPKKWRNFDQRVLKTRLPTTGQLQLYSRLISVQAL